MKKNIPPDTTVRSWLESQPYSLALSSGFFGFYAHCGVLSVLEEQNLLPATISGSSAGALVGTLWASGMTSHLIRDLILEVKRTDFWDPGLGLGFLQGKRFENLLAHHLPVKRLEDCRVPISISVFDVKSRSTRVLSQGCILKAIRASCAVPVMFQPVRVDGRSSLDGGILDRSATHGQHESQRILYHHLVPRNFIGHEAPPRALVPERTLNFQSFEIRNLPKVNPFTLSRGAHAFERARTSMSEILSLNAGRHITA
jgi:NTE family protein